MAELTGRVYDIQGFSVQDGPGIRTTVFLKGCPLRCPWCHSPESMEFFKQLSWMSMRCIGIEKCGKCLESCPKKAISPGETTRHAATQEELRLIRIDREVCDNCGACAEACFPDALYICGEDYTVDRLLERVCKDKAFYEHSDGGVTISGGEALSQPDFTLQLLKGLKERGIHTALDTTGFAQEKYVRAVLPYTDLFLYDLKHMSSEQHKAVIGVPNESILKNAKMIAENGGKMQIRVPVIPRFNDSEENIRRTGEFVRNLGDAVTMVQLLPYHSMGVNKHLRLGENKQVMVATPPSDKKIQTLKGILEEYGLLVTVH